MQLSLRVQTKKFISSTADEDRTRNLRLRKATRYHCATTAFLPRQKHEPSWEKLVPTTMECFKKSFLSEEAEGRPTAVNGPRRLDYARVAMWVSVSGWMAAGQPVGAVIADQSASSSSVMSKKLNNGTLALRFMQNAQRAKNPPEVIPAQPSLSNDAEWHVPQKVRDLWTAADATASTSNP